MTEARRSSLTIEDIAPPRVAEDARAQPVEILFALTDARDPSPSSRVLPARIVVRASWGPPR